MIQPLITVIVPIYNAQKYLERCLNSIVNQTYRNIEIILVNDGSTDNSLSIIEKFKKSDTRIIVVNKANNGVSSARNAGMDICTGDYYLFVDSDDEISQDCIEKMYNAAVKYDSVLLSSDYVWINQGHVIDETCISRRMNERRIWASNYEFGDNLYTRYQIWAIIFKRETLGHLRFDETIHNGEDTLFVVQAILEAGYIDFIGDRLYYHYELDESLENGKINNKKLTVIDSREKILEIVSGREDNHNLQETVIFDTFMWCIRLYNGCLREISEYEEEQLNHILEYIRRKYWIFVMRYKKRNGIRFKVLATILLSSRKLYSYLFRVQNKR